MITFTTPAVQQDRLWAELEASIARVLAHGGYILGPEAQELEERLAAYTGAKHCIMDAKGTAAQQKSLMAWDSGTWDEAATPGFSNIATAEDAVPLCATVFCVDIAPVAYNLNPALLEATITPKTRAIIPVSLYGQPADFDAINAITEFQ